MPYVSVKHASVGYMKTLQGKYMLMQPVIQFVPNFLLWADNAASATLKSQSILSALSQLSSVGLQCSSPFHLHLYRGMFCSPTGENLGRADNTSGDFNVAEEVLSVQYRRLGDQWLSGRIIGYFFALGKFLVE